jgi:hypothetical protein
MLVIILAFTIVLAIFLSGTLGIALAVTRRHKNTPVTTAFAEPAFCQSAIRRQQREHVDGIRVRPRRPAA